VLEFVLASRNDIAGGLAIPSTFNTADFFKGERRAFRFHPPRVGVSVVALLMFRFRQPWRYLTPTPHISTSIHNGLPKSCGRSRFSGTLLQCGKSRCWFQSSALMRTSPSLALNLIVVQGTVKCPLQLSKLGRSKAGDFTGDSTPCSLLPRGEAPTTTGHSFPEFPTRGTAFCHESMSQLSAL